MKKILIVIILIALGYGAYYIYQNTPESVTTEPAPQTKDQKVIAAAKEVLKALADKNYAKLASLTSTNGLSLNEVPSLDLTKSDVAKADVEKIPADTKITLWGYTDGQGAEIYLTKQEFIERYIYNNDYLSAPNVAVNNTLGNGNSINTILQDAAGRDLAAFHFTGFNPEYEGMDWTTIYIIFDQENGEYKVRGIAKDNWTI
jgi:hypothetical protein